MRRLAGGRIDGDSVVRGLGVDLALMAAQGLPAMIAPAIIVSLTSWVMSGWVGPPRGRIDVVTVRHDGRWD